MMKLPPSAAGKLTAMVPGVFSSGPSREGATAKAQNPVALRVSHVPGASLSSGGAVAVRPPLALKVAVRVPSRAPSGARAVLPWPTRSRSLPVYARVRVGEDAGTVVTAGAVEPSEKAAVRVRVRPGRNSSP